MAHLEIGTPIPRPVSIFICEDCLREERRLGARGLPEGWDRVIDCGGLETVRCPDCNEALEQRKTAELNRRVIDAGIAELWSNRDIAMDIDHTVISIPNPPAPRTFAVFLEKQEAGDYRVAMTPEAVLMRWHPLGFWLTPDEADALAVELTDFAKLARRPGTLPDQGGAK